MQKVSSSIGRCYPLTEPLLVNFGDTVNVRFGNIQMNHHPIHLHGHQFKVAGADGFPIELQTQIYKNTILGLTTKNADDNTKCQRSCLEWSGRGCAC
ncbi:multicopper oxidase domain-containing protein [Solibacillus silvestris]|uniref:multicopper oxidase domain-containing protein n=1 Tax=Solibacillus silvestris TaxID=76853 RepID=UPI003F7D9C3C